MAKKTKKVWEILSNQNDIDKNKGLIKRTEEQESVNRFKAHLDYCKQNSKNWK